MRPTEAFAVICVLWGALFVAPKPSPRQGRGLSAQELDFFCELPAVSDCMSSGQGFWDTEGEEGEKAAQQRDLSINTNAGGQVGLRPELPTAGMSYRGSYMRNSCVLLAQDNPVNQEVGRTMIEALGCRVDVASNGYEVLHRMESSRYDVVLLDCRMPVMDGLAAARVIRRIEKLRGGPRTAIIAVGANFTEEDRTRCLDAGMDDCLEKPFHISELSEMMTKWSGRVIWP